MRGLADEMRHALAGNRDLDAFAEMLHEGWCLKRSLGFGICDVKVDAWYQAARKADAQAGKLLGAKGGFLLLMALTKGMSLFEKHWADPGRLSFRLRD